MFVIFQEYPMEYSIFQNFKYFGCFSFFFEYSWNILYSINFDILLAYGFLWNIPFLTFSNSME